MDQGDETRILLREARAIARVRHNNVVPIYGVDRHDDRVGFWSDFVKGKTLSALLAVQGPFGPREAAHIGMDLCRAVGAVHSAGLLHRDIKSTNVMREEGGRILLMDFGLTHNHGEHHSISGTPLYMAPELFADQPASVASDIYALGILLFHLLTGRYPVEGAGIDTLRSAHAAGTRTALLDLRTDVPEPLARVVETATNPDPAKRYATAGQMLSALSEAMSLTPSSVDIPRVAEPKKTFRPWMLLPLALALAFAFPQVRRMVMPATFGTLPLASAREDYQKAHDLLEHYYKPDALETAIPLLEKVVRQDPQYAPAWADLGRANFMQFWHSRDNQYVEPARSASLKALALNPELAIVHVTLAMLYTQTGQNDLAAQEISDALKLDSRNAEAYSAQAELLYRQGRTKDVEPTFQKSVELDPANWRLANEFGNYYVRAGKYGLAAEQFQKAVSLTPDNARALSNLAVSYWRQNRLAEARASLEQSIQLEPSVLAYYNLGHVLEDAGRYQEAAQNFQKAIEQDPSYYPAWGDLAAMYARMGEAPAKIRETYLKAIPLAEESRKQRKNQPALLADLGVYYAHIGDDAKAVPLLRQTVALAPDNPNLLQLAATGFELLHRRDEALKWLGQALAYGRPVALIEQDPTLSALRTDARYKALINPH
jgi:serine/threonine protein kinase/Flp pilus assembly protein TadD